MQKNTASKWIVFAFEDEGGTNPGEPVTGDAANITANVRIDGGAANAVDDTNPTELEDGYYIFDITAAEANGDLVLITPASSTANVNVIGVPGAVYTTPANFNAFGIASDGDISGNLDGTVATVTTLTGHTVQTGDTYALANGSTGFAAIDTVVDSILVDTAEIGAAGAGLTALATASALATVDTNVDSILVDTAEIGAAGAGLTSLATASALATVDTNVDAILVDTATTIPATITTVDTVVDAIKVQTDKFVFTVTNQVDANAKSINDVTVTGAGTSGDPWT